MSRFNLQVGDSVRILKSGLNGRVRFVGQTYFKPGEWVGIELETSEGKNDGTVHGTRYFHCAPGRGIFVRPSAIIVQGSKTTTRNPEKVGAFAARGKTYEFFERTRKWGDPVIGYIKLYFDRKHNCHHVIVCERDEGGNVVLRYPVEAVANLKPSTGSNGRAWVFSGAMDTNTDRVHALKFDRVEDSAAFKKLFDTAQDFDLRSRSAPTDLGADEEEEISEEDDANSGDRPSRRLTLNMTKDLDVLKSKLSAETKPYSDSPSRRFTVTVSAPPVMPKSNGTSAEPPTSRDSVEAAMPPSPPTPSTLARLLGTPLGSLGDDEKPAPSPLLPPGVNSGKSSVDLRRSVADLLKRKTRRSSWLVPSRIATRCIKGYSPEPSHKPFNQDAMVVEQDDVSGAWLFCVFDGHGEFGHKVSHFFSTRIAEAVFSHEHWPSHPEIAIRECVRKLEKQIIKNSQRPRSMVDTTLSGTTAVMAALHVGKLTVANIGDSRIIVGSSTPDGGIRGIDVSHDHKPDLPKEKARIESSGGRVFAIEYDDGGPSPARVWLKTKMLPGLAMSRSLCDTIAKTAGVISEPEITTRNLVDTRDKFLVLGSDGLYEFLSSQEVAEAVQRHRCDPESSAAYLFKESKRLWLENEPVSDDTTIIVIELQSSGQ